MLPQEQGGKSMHETADDRRLRAGRPPDGQAPAPKDTVAAGPVLPSRFPSNWWPAIVALAYGVSGSLWIIASDTLLHDMHLAADLERQIQTYKGWLYVALSTLLLYLLLFAAGRWLRHQQAEILKHHDRLDLALRAARGGTWEHDLEKGEFYMSPYLKLLLGMTPGQRVDERHWQAMIHPDDINEARDRLRDCLDNVDEEQHFTFRLRHANGKYRWISATGKAVYDTERRSWRVLGFGFDITKTKEADKRIQHLIQYDQLTGLPNLSLFKQQLSATLSRQGQHAKPVLCARLEIKEFMAINHMFGARTGDRVLRKVAARLQKEVAMRGLAARLASDEFALFIHDIQHSSDIRRLVSQLMDAVSKDYRIDNQIISLAFNIGIAMFPWEGRKADDLLLNAELALNKAAKKPGSQISFYAAGMNEAFRELSVLGQQLQKAVENDQLQVYFQPIVQANDRLLYGFEALLRWNHPKRGFVAPNIFIPLAEETGLIVEIGNKVLTEACTKAAQWRAASGLPIVMAVNVSPLQIERANFVSEVQDILDRTGLPPSSLELEITESALVENFDDAVGKLQSLRALGVGIAIDDFGTGYSSLHTLRELPVNKLKIDRSFIQDLETSADRQAIVTTILSLAQTLQLKVTAEGIETSGQLDFLVAHACDTVQGYYFGKPAKVDDIRDHLATLSRVNDQHRMKAAPRLQGH